MKLYFWLLFAFFAIALAKRPKQYEKITSIKCKSSGKTVINPKCSIKFYERTASVVNIGFDIIKEVNKAYVRRLQIAIKRLTIELSLQLEYSLFYRNLGNFRQIIKTPKLEACGLIRNADKIGVFNRMMQIMLNSSNNAIHPCPYRIGSFRMDNYTEINADKSFVPIPSGDYKTIFQFSGDDDDNIGKVEVKGSYKKDYDHDFK